MLRPHHVLSFVAAACLAACGSTSADDGGASTGTPSAEPVTKLMNERATASPGVAVPTDERSMSRVLAYVNGEVVNYRDVLLRVGPQLAVVGTEEDRSMLEERALTDILRERIVDQAAREAGLDVGRDDLQKERLRRIREIEKNGGTLDAYLAERGMSAREFDEQVRRELRMSRYLRAAMGRGDGSARVRAVADTFVSPGESRAYYARNRTKAPFAVPDVARVRVLAVRADVSEAANREAALAQARSRAEAALARLRAGEDFVPVYRDLNRDAVEPDPSDGLREISVRGKYQDWIEDFAFTQPRGTLSEILPKGNVFYVLRAEGFTPAHIRPYEECQDEIQQLLGRIKAVVGGLEVELALLEETAITPRERYDALRDYLVANRRRIVDETGL